jgi:hypothetical protein
MRVGSVTVGVGVSSDDGTASVEAFDKQMAVNARGVMLCYQHAARQMISQGRGGRIIGTPGCPFYLRAVGALTCSTGSPRFNRRIFHGGKARCVT